MYFRDFLQEKEEKHGVLAFGRMNPPTTGHEKLVKKVKDVAKEVNGTHHVVLSHSQDKKKNPLSAEQKLKHAKRFFPNTNLSAADKDSPTILHHAARLHKAGVTHLHVIGGSDRTEEYNNLLHKYNGVKSAHGHYKFKKITVHSSGERDPDAEGVSGMSASKMREHAKSGDFESFKQGVPSSMKAAHARQMYNDVRSGMRLHESILSEGVHDKGIFKAFFLGGGPGSGKDYVLSNTLDGHGLVEINSDKALEYLMDKEGLDKKMPDNEEAQRNATRKRAKNVTELRQRLALHGRNGLIINGTGDDPQKYMEIKKKLEKLGYDTHMIMVNTKDEVSKERNVERGQRGGRTVPENIRKEKWDSVQRSRPELAKLFGNKYIEFDNSEDLRSAAPEVVKAKKEEMLQLFKNVQNFVSKEPESENAQEWVAGELHKKDTLPIKKGGAEMISRWMGDDVLTAVQKIKPIADEVGLTMGQFALAWALQNTNVSSVIMGATKPSQVKENVKASGVKLSTEVMKAVEDALYPVNKHPQFGPGDNITVSYKITEGNKERIQEFRGDVIQVRGNGATKSFTVRKMSNGVGVERIFPILSPAIEKIEVLKIGKVRRAKLYYMKGRHGKSARIKEKLTGNVEA